jgi:hypothetical protein
MRWTKLSLMAALSFGSPWVVAAQEAFPPELVAPAGPAAERHVGDGIQHVGDAVHNIGDTVQIVKPAPELSDGVVVRTQPATFRASEDSPAIPRLTSALLDEPESESASDSEITPSTVSEPIDIDCDTCTTPVRRHGRHVAWNRWWGEFDTLLWWGRNRELPPLVATAPGDDLPILGLPGTEVLYGGPTAPDPQIGLRFDLGRYLGNCEDFGVGFRFTYLGSLDAPFTTESDGTRPLGIPYFETTTGLESVIDLAGGDPDSGFTQGFVQANDDMDFISVEPYLRVRLCEVGNHRFDLIGGYTYQLLRNDFTLVSATANLDNGDLIPDGAELYADGFFVDNNFHGGHFGFQGRMQRRRLIFEHLFKMHLGNMRQEVQIIGGSLTLDPNAPPIEGDGGIFALPSNIGTYKRDEFTFIPELNLKLGYAINQRWTATIGYTFLYFDNVALAGNLIDRQIDGTQQGGLDEGDYPQFAFKDSSYWLQGIDFGLQYNW